MAALRPLLLGVMLACLGSATTASASVLFTVNESGDVLESYDTTTSTFTTIGPLGVTFDFGGLAYNSSNGLLYGVDGRGAQQLFTVDMNTGAATVIGTHGIVDLFGIAYDSVNNRMYGTQFARGSSLYEMNMATGAATLIGNMGTGIGGLTYDSANDRLLGVSDGAGTIFEIDRGTASTTVVANPGGNNDSGFTYDPENNLYWNIDWNGNLYSLDPTNSFNRTLVASGLGAHDGLAYVSDFGGGNNAVPEPSSIAIWSSILLGGLGLGWRRKRLAS